MNLDPAEPTVPEDVIPIIKSSGAKQWAFTLFTYQHDEHVPADPGIPSIEDWIKVLDFLAAKYVFQEERCETTNRLHLQGFFILKKKMRRALLLASFGYDLKYCPSISVVRELYAIMNYVTKVATSTGNHRVEKGFNLILKPYKGEDLITELKDWQKEIFDICMLPWEKRTIHWYWDKNGGIGKSSFSKYMSYHHNAILVDGGRATDIENHVFNAKHREIIIMDIPRCGFASVSYRAIENCKNGSIFNKKYETGQIMFLPPHIIIFANSAPDLSMMSTDRWHVVELSK